VKEWKGAKAVCEFAEDVSGLVVERGEAGVAG